jgi:hypothetical protein
MATSYTRQSSFSDGDTITAALFNDEFNQLLTAFSYASSGTTGHRHDGTAGEGGNIHTIGDQDFLNKIVVDSTNNRWGVYVEVSGSAVEQIRIQDGAIVPVTDNDIDLGTSSLEFKDLYLDGTATVDALVADTADINGGSVDGATIGAASASTGSFTTLAASGAVTLSSTLSVEGNTTLGNAATDTVTVTADVASDLIPSADSTHSLGDSSNYWANAYVDAITTTGNVSVGGNLTVTGTTTFNGGTLTLGDAADDNVVFGADVNSSIIPNTDNTYDLGSSTQEWRDLYIDGTAYLDSINFNGTAITATAAELNILDGVTATATELNILDGVTSTTAELNKLDGVTATTAELNILAGKSFLDEDNMASDSATGIASQQSIKAYVDSQVGGISTSLSGLTDTNVTSPADGALLFYDTTTSKWIDNVVSGDVTIADTGVAAISSGVIVNADINASAAIDVSKTALTAGTGLTLSTDTLSVDAAQTQITSVGTLSSLSVSGTFTLGGTAVTSTAAELNILDGVTATTAELNYVDGVTSAIQTQLDAKAPTASPTFTGLVTVNSTDALKVPVGTTAQRPSAAQGQIRYNTTTSGFEGYDGSSWSSLGAQFAYTRTSATATASQTTFSATYTAGYVDVYLNGVKLISGTDFTATNGTSVVLTTGAAAGDLVEILAYETFQVANAILAGNNLSDLSSAATALTNLGLTATAAEINTLDGITSTVSELNILDGVTATATELNILDGVTATTAELNILDGVTSTATELNLLDGVTATTAEINYLDITTLGTTEASKAVTADANGVVTFDNGKIEESTAITSSSGAATINLRNGDNFTHTLSENVTYTFSNPAASGKVSAFTLKVTQDSTARTITWPSSVDWAAATAPTLTATSGGVDVFVFVTYDGGTTYYGFTAGQAMA